MATFQSGRGALHYEALGDGPPVVLIHGFTNYGLFWTPQLAALVHAGYRVILPDLHGHGASEPATALCTVADLVADVTALLDHLGTGPATLCGLSLGGMIALQMALDHPQRVAGMVVASSRASTAGAEFAALVAGWTVLFEQDNGPVMRLNTTWPMLVNESCRDSGWGRAAFDAWSQVLATVPGESLSHVARGMLSFDLQGRLASIRVPTLVIAGERDALFRPEQTRGIADAIAGSAFAVISGAGHLSSLDSADQFNRLLLEFLRERA